MAIAIESLRAGYGPRTVLFDVDCEVRTGEILGIFGHNGAGKTTLLRVLAGSLLLPGPEQYGPLAARCP